MSLREKTFSAVRWTSLSAIVRGVIQFAQVAILARLLTHEDFGLMAIIWVVIQMANILVDSGIGAAYMQRKEVTEEQRSSLFWFNVFLGLIVTLMMVLASPMLGWFFGDDRYTTLMMLCAPTLLINALSMQLVWTAEKKLEFRSVSIMQIASTAIGFGVTMLTAFGGWGVYSFIAGSIIASLAATAFAWRYCSLGWRPQLRFKFKEIESFVRFGWALIGGTIVSILTAGADLLIGGRMATASQLGLYSVPRNLIIQVQMLLGSVIARVGFPLTSLVQDDIPRVRGILLRSHNILASLCAPLYVGLSFFAEDVVQLTLGSNWNESVVILQTLSLWGFFKITAAPDASLTLGVGRVDLLLKWNIASLFVVPPVLWVSIHYYGLSGMSLAMLVLFIALIFPRWLVFVRPICQAGLYEYLKSFLKPFFISLLAISSAYFIAMKFDGVAAHLIVGVTLASIFYFAICWKFNHEWMGEVMQLLGRKKTVSI